MPKGKRRKVCKETGKKPTHKRRRKHWSNQASLVKFTTDTTKLAVTGLVGANLISTLGVSLKNVTKK